jgi:hypothetical protein
MAARDDGLRAETADGALVNNCLAATRAEVLAAASGHVLARAIHVACDLGLADCFQGESNTAAAVGSALGVDATAVRRLLHLLSRNGFFEETADGSFLITSRGAMLRSDAPGATADVIRSLGHPGVWEAFRSLEQTIRSGTPPLPRLHGLYEPSGRLPHERDFSRAMSGYHWGEPEALADNYDFSGFRSIVDVGGSGGALICTLLERFPTLHGTIFDRPGLEEEALATIASRGLEKRCTFIGGDFFRKVPEGKELYILSHILHDWPEQEAVSILRSCSEAMGMAGRLIILEALITPGGEGESEIPADILLLANTGGRLRTLEEHRTLLAAAGLRFSRTVSCGPLVSLIEAARS